MPSTTTETITSLDNPLVRLARSLQEASGRRRHRAFLVEGLRLVEAAAEAARPSLVLHGPGFGWTDERERALLRAVRGSGAQVREVSERVLEHVADTVTPQGIVAVMPLPASDIALATPAEEGLILVLDGVGDPGNAGTLLRSAVGAGVDGVWCVKGTVDVFAPKVVRAGAGAHFHGVLATDLSWDTIRAHLPLGRPVLVADAAAEQRYWEVDWTRPSVLVLSSEAHGASEEARALATGTVSIPIAHVESLNVGVAGSVILFEAQRQRLTKNQELRTEKRRSHGSSDR
jgi:TrmH family RNA methyltransferase